jgi:hypothetical protein
MPKSNRPGLLGRGYGGTVTVIEEPVLRSYARKAKIVFWIIWVATGLLTATVLASRWHPIVALILGGLIALVPAFIAAALVAAWPVIRAIWWWIPELAVIAALTEGWIELAAHTGLALRLIYVALIIGIPAAIGPVRRTIFALAWCQISRHRIRACFSEFIITNRTGSLPFILGARPTPAGERLWIWLRPGLALADIQDRLDKIAAACWATAVIADQANPSNSALIRIDIKRRDPLTGRIGSPLTALAGGIIPARKTAGPAVQAGLDLPDIEPADVTVGKPASARPAASVSRQRPQWPDKPSRNSADAEDDINDWI